MSAVVFPVDPTIEFGELLGDFLRDGYTLSFDQWYGREGKLTLSTTIPETIFRVHGKVTFLRQAYENEDENGDYPVVKMFTIEDPDLIKLSEAHGKYFQGKELELDHVILEGSELWNKNSAIMLHYGS